MKRNVLIIVFMILITSCSNKIGERIEYFDSTVKETNEDIIKIASFTDLTSWPEYVEDYVITPKKLLEWGKTPILNVRKLHEKGFTGEGVKVAIIDGALNVEHEEFENKEIHYDNSIIGKSVKIHGTTVASLLCGENVGIAPEVELFYFATETTLESGYDNKIKALKKIRDYNIENVEPIRIVSISIGQVDELIHYEEFIEEIRILEKQGTIIFWVSMEQRICPGVQYKLLEDRSDFNSLVKGDFYKGILGNIRLQFHDKDSILLPWANFTVAHDIETDKYTYLGNSSWGMSWIMPIISGFSALALQANDCLSKKDIIEKLKKSGKKYYGGTTPNPEKFLELCIEG